MCAFYDLDTFKEYCAEDTTSFLWKNITSVFLPEMPNLSLIMGKHQTNPNGKTFNELASQPVLLEKTLSLCFCTLFIPK